MNCYIFAIEPMGAAYAELVAFCCLLASKMILIVRDPQKDPGDAIKQKLARLEACRIETVLAREWPGTVLHAHDAAVHWYQVTADLEQGMRELAPRLYAWAHSGGAPEDPCFFRADGQVVLVTVAHEHDAYLMLTESELLLLQERFPNLASLLREEGEK